MTRLRILTTAGPLAASALAFAAPASAQDYPPPLPVVQPLDDFGDEIVVYGRYRSLPGSVEHLSQRVSYADLDLYYDEDRRELRRRVSFTARYLCDRLGESYSSSIGPNCRDAATRDAMRRVGTVAEGWAPRDTAWLALPRRRVR